MLHCKLCNKFSLGSLATGLCGSCLKKVKTECAPIVETMQAKMNRFDNNGYKVEIKVDIARETITLAKKLLKYEELGIGIMDPKPSVVIARLQKYIDENTDNAEDVTPTSIAKAKKLLKTPYVVLDFETTGLSAKDDKIIEIGAVKVENGAVIDEFSTFVNPLRPIPAAASRKNHIHDSDVKDAPVIEFVIGKLVEFIGGNIVVAHNAPFDIGFYCAALGGNNETIQYIDTVKMAKKAFPETTNQKLDTLVKELDLPRGKAHRALDDAKCTQVLYEMCLKSIAKVE